MYIELVRATTTVTFKTSLKVLVTSKETVTVKKPFYPKIDATCKRRG